MIIRYVYNKSFPNNNVISDIFDINNIILYPAIEGTLLSIFRFNNKLYFSTKKCFDASKSFWHSEKSFTDLFLECWGLDNNFNDILENICYNFIIIHPENNNTIKYNQKSLILINARSFGTLNIHNITLNNPNVTNFNLLTIVDVDMFINNLDTSFNYVLTAFKLNNKDNFYRIFNKMSDLNTHKQTQGYFITDGIKSQKILFDKYVISNSLKPNCSDSLFSYFLIRKNSIKLQEYLKYFPEEYTDIKHIESNIYAMIRFIHMLYIQQRVIKNINIIIPQFLKTTLYKIHGLFLQSREQITVNFVYNYINSLNEKQLITLYRKYLQTYINVEMT